MKNIYLILLLSLLYFCGCSTLQKNNNFIGNVKILSIDEEVLKNNYLIKCLDYSSNDTILTMLPKKHFNRDEVKVKKSYYFDLKRVTIFIEDGEKAGIILNKGDVYLEGVLIFPSKTKVYEVLSWKLLTKK